MFLIAFDHRGRVRKAIPFQFEKFWLLCNGIQSVVKNAWHCDGHNSLVVKLIKLLYDTKQVLP